VELVVDEKVEVEEEESSKIDLEMKELANLITKRKVRIRNRRTERQRKEK
jgi:hypothetical protein